MAGQSEGGLRMNTKQKVESRKQKWGAGCRSGFCFLFSKFLLLLSPGFRVGSEDGLVRQVPGAPNVACRTLLSAQPGRVNVPTSTPSPVSIQPVKVFFIQRSMFIVRRSLSCLIFWFTTKRLCMWCEPHHWLGGNPFAHQHTGGMC